MYISYGKLSSEYYNYSKPISTNIMGDINFYIKRLKNINGLILEAGVGTGRILIPLLERNLKVEGIDNSEYMLNICKKELEKRGLCTNLFNEDLLQLNKFEKYEAIIMPTGSFMLIKDYERVLKNFYNALKENGKLILDISPPSEFIENKTYTNVLEINSKEGIVLQTTDIYIDYINQYTKSILKYEKYIKGSLKETELQEFILYYYGLREFELILEKIGFREIEVFFDYDLQDKSNKNIQMITFEAKK